MFVYRTRFLMVLNSSFHHTKTGNFLQVHFRLYYYQKNNYKKLLGIMYSDLESWFNCLLLEIYFGVVVIKKFVEKFISFAVA